MADHDRSALPPLQHAGDDGPALPVKVVGGFVQHQHVRRVQQQGGQPEPRLLAPAQRPGGSGRIKAGQTDPGQRRRDAVFQGPVRLGQIVGRPFAGQHAREDRQAVAHAKSVRHGSTLRRPDDLFQKSDPAPAQDGPVGRLGQAGYQPQQGGLAHAVAADHAGAFTPEGEAQVGE